MGLEAGPKQPEKRKEAPEERRARLAVEKQQMWEAIQGKRAALQGEMEATFSADNATRTKEKEPVEKELQQSGGPKTLEELQDKLRL